MPQIIGEAQRVVQTSSFTIDELAGNVASGADTLSIAHCKISAPTGEPWLTLDYDEWLCILKGVMLLHHAGGTLEARAGQTVFVGRGERFRPEFPEAGTEYVPVCIPAFRPDRCKREDDPSGEVPQTLAKLHSAAMAKLDTAEIANIDTAEDKPEELYHMCLLQKWVEAKASGAAYFPPTFDEDGFTHATAVPSRLIETANHFYQGSEGDWVCLRFTRSSLRRCGIIVKDEGALPVGAQAVGATWSEWVCPHVYGGLPIQVVYAELPIVREGPVFKSIPGLDKA